MNILADVTLPLLDYFFADYGSIRTFKPGTLTPQTLEGADMLLVRSTTKVNAGLLAKAHALRFVGSCVTGTDHIDRDYLAERHIPYYAAEGCNAQAVLEYVMSVIAALQIAQKLPLRGKAAVIGVGRIGAKVAQLLQHLGYEVLTCDPLRAHEPHFQHTPLAAVQEVDFIAVHTPLTADTYHMLDKDFFERQKPGCALLNAGRGEVIHEHDLLRYAQHLTWCLDVFEHEPQVNRQVIESAYIATPHIAGHSVEGKARGTEMVYQAAAARYGWVNKAMPLTQILWQAPRGSWQDKVLAYADPRGESQRMKQALATSQMTFTELRASYFQRHEFAQISGLALIDSEFKSNQ